MKKALNTLLLSAIIIGVSALLVAFVSPQDKKDGGAWNIPAKYKEMKNPHSDDASLMKVGKMMYSKHCKSCHGSKGLGDGPKASSLKTNMRPLNGAAFQSQSDGVVYYQSFIGRDEMPNFEKKIPDDEDRWAIVNYMRSLK